MLDKLRAIKDRWEDVERQISDPKVISDMKLFTKLNREYKELGTIVNAYHRYKKLLEDIDSVKGVLMNEKDEDFRAMAKAEMEELSGQKEKIEPQDPEDLKPAVVELRAGTGGDEASIFAGDLFRMYSKYCDSKGLKVEIIDFSAGTAGGYKEVIFNVSGDNPYGTLKFESGVHRVQRVPQTETQGRVHTSAATVIVMPEADEVDVTLNPADVNKVETKVQLTHKPTGLVVVCQVERSQLGNRERAMQMLRTKLYEMELLKHNEAISKKRKTMVSTGDRSEKIRTYNYPQSRITDHRINLTIHNLPNFMNGDIQEMIDALQLAENAERLKEGGMAV
jgi:peptide chain release factor 1